MMSSSRKSMKGYLEGYLVDVILRTLLLEVGKNGKNNR
jgi:hypothetical protein